NILVEENYKMIPGDGVYAVEVTFPSTPDDHHFGMCNIGVRPTFNGQFKTIEVHIFNFNRDIYGENLTLRFVNRLREEQKFSGAEELQQQLKTDEANARTILGIG